MHLGYSKTSLRDGYLWDTSHYTHLYIHIDCWICLNVTTSGYQQDSVSLYPITHNHVASLYPGRAMYMHETWYCVIGLLKVIYFKTGSQNAAKRLRHPCYESWYPALKVNYLCLKLIKKSLMPIKLCWLSPHLPSLSLLSINITMSHSNL